MNLRILGCSGGISGNRTTTSLLVDNDILIDGGTGIGELDREAMASIRHIFVTHSHLDHIAGIPMLIDTVFENTHTPIILHAREETLATLKKNIFNWEVWPDFTELPNASNPVVKFEVMAPGEIVTLNQRRIEMIGVNHSVPGAGFRLQNGGKSFAFSGDTTSNDSFWSALNEHHDLDILIVESAFADEDLELSRKAYHYCPQLLAADLDKLNHRPEVYITHMKPGYEDIIIDQCRQQISNMGVNRLCGGDTFQL